MSAIFGLVNLDGRPAVEAELGLMSAALAAHGPDGSRLWANGNVGLGQRLMLLTPEDCLERQTAVHPGEQHVLVSDARIDNRPELIHELGILPAEARELSDSDFILRAYEKWGEDCARHLVGAFVFALCDLPKQTIVVARSPMGERSLFYYETPRALAFASAPKGLFALPYVRREVNRQSIADFLAFTPTEPGASFFSGVNRLPAGHVMVVRAGAFSLRQYRRVEVEPQTRFPRDSDYVEAFNALFDRVISDHLRSLTPAGVSMSGGLDSTAIAAAAALKLGQEGKRLHTFTEVPRPDFNGAVPKDRYADETPYVQAMARRYDNLDVHFVRSDGRFYLDELHRLFAAAEAPILGASNWTWIEAILQAAGRLNVRVLLTGALGNLTISWDGRELLPQLVRGREWRQAFREAHALAAMNRSSTLRTLVGQGLMPLLPDPLWASVEQLRAGRIPGFAAGPPWQDYSPMRQEFAIAQKVEQRAREKRHDFRFRAPAADRARDLPRQADHRSDLRRADEALFGVQKRDPTADFRLAEFCFSIPEDQYLRNGQSRWLIRRATADRLPVEILQNTRRGLQAADWFESLSRARSRLAEELVRLERSALASEIIDLGRMRHLTERIPNVRSDTPHAARDYRLALELGITMGHFLAWVEGGV